MLPSLLAREVQTGLKKFLTVGFEPSDALFGGVVERFTEQESRWMKGPFLQMGLPFRTGSGGRGFFSGFETQFPGFVHQEKAWERLASNRLAAPTLVATGTGSGKTECFLYPLLDHCARAKAAGLEGIKALVIYPMNALATDQAGRFARVIAATPAFEGLRVGLFVGGQTTVDPHGQSVMTPTGVITDRETMRGDPPDILLTNYKMLDYLLIRPKDRQLWSKNAPETLRYVVVDELHTFDGAQGTDLALLLRRLRARLNTPAGGLICVGTSATLGGNADTAPLRDYARQVFGFEFPPDSVVTENRLSEAEFLGSSPIEHVLEGRSDFTEVLAPDRYRSQQEAVAAWFPVFFATESAPSDVNDPGWRRHLGLLLKRHLLFVNLVKLCQNGIVALGDLHQQMQGPLPEPARTVIGKVLDALLALVAWARGESGQPLVTLRVQVWLRELRRMVATVSARPAEIELTSDSDVRAQQSRLHLPLVQCRDCHCTGWLSRLPGGQSQVSRDLDLIYNTWFGSQPETARFYGVEGLKRPQAPGLTQWLCTSCGLLRHDSGKCSGCGCEELVEVFRVTASRTSHDHQGLTSNWHEPICPACGNRGLLLLGARSTTLGSIIIEQAWASPYNDDKKLIAFSDSVQDAAHRAGFFTARTYLNTVRTALARVIDHVAKPACGWSEFLDAVWSHWWEEGAPMAMPREEFVAEFIGPNMLWQRDWKDGLLENGALPKSSRLPERVRKRLAWQAHAEFTYLSRRGRNLETVGKAVLSPEPAVVRGVAKALLPALQEQFGLRHLDERRVFHWLWGFLIHLKAQGAVTHAELASFMVDGKIFSFSKSSRRGEWLPGIGPRAGQPKFLCLGAASHDYERLKQSQGRTFYEVWLAATLGEGALLAENMEPELYGAAISAFEAQSVLQRVTGKHGDVVGLNASALVLDSRTARIVSAQGKRALTVPEAVADDLLGMPCLQAPQESYSTKRTDKHWFAHQFSRGDLRRIFSAEHTSLLDRPLRETIERRFKDKRPRPWFENLLSATPTLEMGVDIGDLSSVMLCSVPPNQASYLQRIGRAGRTDGNAFASTLADGASPHDLYFFEDTREMLAGEVTPPGIFLRAPEVLRRQLFAFCLDQWVCTGIPVKALPDKTAEALDACEIVDESRFPHSFLAFMQTHQDTLLTRFKALLGPELDARVDARLTHFMQGDDESDNLRMRLLKVLTELKNERKSHVERADRLKKRAAELKKLPSDDATRDEIERSLSERQKALGLVKEINDRELLNTLTDAGLIPNYAFPEAGIELKSILWRKRTSDDPEGTAPYISLPAERYERSAQSALSEFAPENVFYANRRKVQIEQINMELSKVEEWRLCPSCHHAVNLEKHPDTDAVCPRPGCGDPMWANISQKRKLIRFKQAIANSDDAKVQIDDSAEDREPKFHVRQLLTSFSPSDVREAYRLPTPETPFGFEFIERVTFRDINFGEPTKPGDTYAVAGEQRLRPGFKLCKHCGQVQRKPRDDRERAKAQLHAFDCPKADSDDLEDLIDCLYLYREFDSEALRILVPFTKSGVDAVSVRSFMAALRVGLKRRYGGKVDHLRLITQEERSTDGGVSRHYVFIYDSVPGGTGYLHELLADGAATLVALIRLALEHLRNCACNSDPLKDGCYRCVYQYRLGRDMALVSRNRARAVLEAIDGNLDQLQKGSSISDIYVNPDFDSALESRFIECLRSLGGKEGLEPVQLIQDIVHGKPGYLLQAGSQTYWIEPQVNLNQSDGVAEACKPDFVLWPAKSPSFRKPIAVFCDGWAHHKNIARDDARKRNALVASGKYWVWSVAWQDVKSALAGKAESDLAGSVEPMMLSELPEVMKPKWDPMPWTQNAISSLLRWIQTPGVGFHDDYVRKLFRSATALAFRMVPDPRHDNTVAVKSQLEAFWSNLSGTWPCERPHLARVAGNVNDPSLMFRYFVSPALAGDGPALPSPGFLVLHLGDLDIDDERRLAWRRWLWMFNALQTLPGCFLATTEGLAEGDYGAIALVTHPLPAGGSPSVAAAAGWETVLDQVMENLRQNLEDLSKQGFVAPNEVGYELEENGMVVAEAELAWIDQKLIVLLPEQAEHQAEWLARGWRVVEASGDWPKAVAAALGFKSA